MPIFVFPNLLSVNLKRPKAKVIENLSGGLEQMKVERASKPEKVIVRCRDEE